MAGHLDVIAWLRSLPAGCELAWSDDATCALSGFSYGFVDAYVPLLARELGWNWIWSIFPMDAERAEEERWQREYAEDRGRDTPSTEVRFTPGALEDLGIVGIKVEVEGAEGWSEVKRAGQETTYSLEEVSELFGIDLDALRQESSGTYFEPPEPDPLNLTVAYDATLEVRFREKECLGGRLLLDRGPVVAVSAELLDGEGLQRGQARDLRLEGDVLVRSRRAWSISRLEQALEEWVAQHAQRDDLKLKARDEISESPLAHSVRDRLQRLEDSDEASR
jgi:hypothetical protein